MGGTHVLSNLRTLCRPCNSRRPVAGEAFIADLAVDGLTLDDMKVLCMHVHARVEGKGREGNKEGKGTCTSDPAPPPPPCPQKLEVGSWFGRRATTPWSDKELKAWKTLHPESITEGIEILAGPYSAKEKFCRRDLLTLLNNWQGEIDRWRSHAPILRSDVTPAQSNYEDPPFLTDDDANFHTLKP